jgi:thiopurine S-methyltransferase
MDTQFWLNKWEQNQIGFHQPEGFNGLNTFWPILPAASRVLVPLCGKSRDLLWLLDQGLHVTGVELSEIAIRAFFSENKLTYNRITHEGMTGYEAIGRPLVIFCHDFMKFNEEPFDAMYDRAAMVAMPPALRRPYVRHCQKLLAPDSHVMLVTLEYDQSQMKGPPFSVMPDEVTDLWEGQLSVERRLELIEEEPRFKERGLTSLVEKVWQNSDAT